IINGQITAIKTSGSLSKVEVKAGCFDFKTIVIDTPETADYLQTGNKVKLVFKETEVAIATGELFQISLQNRISGSLLKLEIDALQAKVTLDTKIGHIKSIITADAAHQLNLQEGMTATALIKTNEVMLSL
ncbi:MAG: TOBE domain-containing protein, partial [Flavobacteriaceae bacterium]|nr:TOBE domain-containing protein [Psychroflexus sp.]